MRRPSEYLFHFLLVIAWSNIGQSADDAVDPYDALYDSIMIREVKRIEREMERLGNESPTPLLWKDSQYLLKGDSGIRFHNALNTFASLDDTDIAAYSPVKRAILQRHLWAVFDWAVLFKNPKGEPDDSLLMIRKKVSQLIPRLALSEQEIADLPDPVTATSRAGIYPSRANLADQFQPFFPENLLDPTGPWICLTKARQRLMAESHTQDERWRSSFQIFMRLPGERKDTLRYLEKLGEFREQWTTVKPTEIMQRRTRPSGGIHEVEIYVNPATPQFPEGTQFAMIEQILLITATGEIVPSPLVGSLQLREYLRVEASFDLERPDQAVAEFHLNPKGLMKGNNSLIPLGSDEPYLKTLVVGNDPFEKHVTRIQGTGPRLRSCMKCHNGWGIHSVNSRAQMFETITLMPPRLQEGNPNTAIFFTIEAKKNDVTWGMLRGLTAP